MKKKIHAIITLTVSFIMIMALSVVANADASTQVPEDGLYKVEIPDPAPMCKILAEDNNTCDLLVKDGKMTAVFRLNSDGYDKIYVGTKEAAAVADQSEWIYRTEEKRTIEDEGVEITTTICTYEMPVEALGTGISVATHSISKGETSGANYINGWYDRTFIFSNPRGLTAEETDSIIKSTQNIEMLRFAAEAKTGILPSEYDALQQKYDETEAARIAAVTAKSNAESTVSKLNTTVSNLNAKITVMGTKVGGVKAKAYRSSHKITVSWSKNSKVTGYKVYRATSLNGSYKAVKTTTSNTATIKNHKKGKTYYYKVIGYKNVAGSNVYTKDSAICVVKAK